ncbi:MAG: DNA methyltransferase [Archaeoglobales archaeon]|nr:DNA methyltransferase [Archaeoglobales archaeon]
MIKKLTDFAIIEEEDWTFAGEDTKYLTHGFHPYPARMVPLIARKIIEKYATRREDVVLDPFCGSGTVLVESVVHEKDAIGFEINPLAVMIAKTKTNPIDPGILKKTISEIIKKISSDELEYPEPLNIPNLRYWFKPEVIKELSKIYHHIKNVEEEHIYNFLSVAFSYCVWKVSNIKKGEYKLYRMPKTELLNWNPDVISTFTKILYDNLKGMQEFYRVMQNKTARADVQLKDVRECELEDFVTLVLTSPPYGDSKTTVAYGQFSKYSALWLGLRDVVDVDRKSLGGVRKRGDIFKLESKTFEETFNKIHEKDTERAWDLYSFFYDIDIAISKLSRALKMNRSHMVFVVGNRTMRRVKVPSDRILVEISDKYGFKHEKTIYRKIPSKRIPWKNSPENISGLKSETINSEAIIVWKY